MQVVFFSVDSHFSHLVSEQTQGMVLGLLLFAD